jgi:hypothetical protein
MSGRARGDDDPSMTRIFPVLMVAVAVLAACNSGGSRISDREFQEEAERIAADALLTLDDLPDGWDAGPRDDDDEDDPFEDEEFAEALGEECAEQIDLFEDEDSFPDSEVDIESDFFDDPDTDDEEEVGSGIAIYRDSDELDEAWDQVTSFISDCEDDFERAFAEFFDALIEEEQASQGGGFAITASDVSFESSEVDDLGDDAFQWTFTFEVELAELDFSLQIEGNVLFVRTGRTVATFEWTDYGEFDRGLADELTELVVERAEEADEALPE